MIVDSKVPLEAYMESLSATDPAEQERLLTEHARHVRAHSPPWTRSPTGNAWNARRILS